MSEPSRDDFGPLPAEEWGEVEYDAFGKVLGIPGEQVPRAGSGHPYDPLNFDVIGAMVRHPALAQAYFRYNTWLLRSASLPARLRELSVLRVAQLDHSEYLWAEHVRVAREEGLTIDEIRSVAAGNARFGDAELVVLEATDELVLSGRVVPETWDRLCSRLGAHASMELIFVVGTYRTLASALSTWGLAREPAEVSLPSVPGEIVRASTRKSR